MIERQNVAPRAGAWIETRALSHRKNYTRVAPRAGAWIETFNLDIYIMYCVVAPRAGAWIETLPGVHMSRGYFVAPARARGLKQE